jgi:FHA domain-containing protein
MPKLTLMLDRKTVQVYDLERPVIRVGRIAEMDIVIDNVSVSRRQAEIERDGDGWVVRDIGSSNGTFVNGERLTGDRPLRAGDEIGIGKYSLFFERAGSDAPAAPDAPPAPRPSAAPRPARQRSDATMMLEPDEVDQLRKSVAQKRQAHLVWESGGRSGTHFLGAEGTAALIGTGELCDVRVPRGPKHHVLAIRGIQGVEVRNLSFWRRMRVKGQATLRARLGGGDVVEIAGLKLTFMDEVR